MASPPHGIYDSFTEQGLFWLPDHPDDQVSGSLIYDPENGTVLKLLGILGEVRGQAGDDERAAIYGVTTRGKPISLLHAIKTKQQINIPGIAHETWGSNLLVIGAHIASADDDAIFSKSYFRFEEIELWLEHSPFTSKFNSDAKTLNILAEKPREATFASHADFDVTTVGSLYSENESSTRFVIDVTTQMAITPREQKSLNWHLNRAGRLQELASLCTGHFLALTSFELRSPDVGNGNTGSADVHFYAQMVHGEGRGITKPSRTAPIVTGPELIRFNPQAVQHWFDQFEVFDPALRLFFTITGARKMFTNIRLLLAIQALEVFHRRTSDESVMAEQEFAEFSEDLVAAIPPDTGADMREKLESLYQFANELSLKQRLRSIVASLTDAFGEAPAGFDSKFLRKLVDTRNYYTHFSAELSPRTLSGAEMYWATRRVVLLLTLLFLQRLGIAANEIKPLLQRHREFAQLWAKADRPR